MIYAVHRIDPDNLGDQMCCAMDYSGIRTDITVPIVLDIHAINNEHLYQAETVLVGGGGLIHGQWTEWLHGLAYAARRSRLITWGIGVNNHDTESLVWPKFLDRFELVGLRDYGNPWRYVPDPSVLHVQFPFARCMKPSVPLVNYNHHLKEVWQSDGPFKSNKQPASEFLSILEYLASGEIVQTNTFHGAYWALLLGRKVCLVSPNESRMFSFPERLPTSPNDAVAWPDYYDECLALNMEFRKRVLKLL